MDNPQEVKQGKRNCTSINGLSDNASSLVPGNAWDEFMKDAVIFKEDTMSTKNENVALQEYARSSDVLLQDNEINVITEGLIKKYTNDASCVSLLIEFKKYLNPKTKLIDQRFIGYYDHNRDLVDQAVRQMDRRDWHGLMDAMSFEDAMRLGVRSKVMKERVFSGNKPYFLERLNQLDSDNDGKELDYMDAACLALKEGYVKELFDDDELFGRNGILFTFAKRIGKTAFIEKTRGWVERMNQMPGVQTQGQSEDFNHYQQRSMMFQGLYLSLINSM